MAGNRHVLQAMTTPRSTSRWWKHPSTSAPVITTLRSTRACAPSRSDSGALRIHAQMIRVYFARGWDDRATQRTTLLDRILTLTPDEQLRASLDSLVQPRTGTEGQPVPA